MPDSRTSNTLSIHLLGCIGIEPDEGRKAPALPRKGWAILSYLAATPGQSQPRDRLAEIFWPTHSIEAARNNLRQVLLNLQRMLNDRQADTPCLEADRRSIRLNPESRHAIDLVDFLRDAPECTPDAGPAHCESCILRLERMAALYRGEFLDGLYLEQCEDFDEWLQVHREALLRRALVLLERISECHENQGRVGRALGFAQRYCELEPWNEEGQRRLIRLLALSGQRGAALSQYESCCRFLKLELGVQPEEETRELARSIQSGELLPSAVPQGSDIAVPAMPSMALERRQVTVLYCQISPSGTDDPDEILDLLRPAQKRCSEIIRQFSGHVVRTNDGGLLAYFGYPQAHEHAPHLAVRAGLALVTERFPEVELRIGIHTGLVITSGDPNLPDSIGKTSNLAIRLRALMGPSEVGVSAATQRLVRGYFEWEEQPPQSLGGPQPETLFKALEESGATDRLAAAVSLSPLTGREKELSVLRERWKSVLTGKRQALLLQGDPGIGKSRLVHALKQKLAGTPCIVREFLCLAESSQSPFQPVIELLKTTIGFAPEDSPEERFRKLVSYQHKQFPDMDQDEIIPLLAEVLSVPLGPPYRKPDMSSRVQRERIMEVLVDQLVSLAAQEPVLLVVEDLHWSDPTTLELLSRILADSRPASILVLLTARPEFRSPWPESAAPVHPLSPLGDSDVTTLVESLGMDIPEAAMRHIVEHADGVPLFVEELARAIPLTGETNPTAIPSTLHDLLAARLDSLGEAKTVAQLASAIGREFPMALLRELSPLDETALTSSLIQLRGAGLLAGSVEAGFQFRHALFQDAAYQSQTRSDRRDVHKRIAETLQSRFPEIAATRPEVLARHWAAGDEAETAIGYWIKAGRLANLHCANTEAISHFTSALALIEDLPGEQRRIEFEFELQVGLGAAVFAAEGYASPNGAAAYARAVELGEMHRGNPDLFPALWGLWACTSSRADYDESLTLTLRLLKIAQRSKDPIELQQGHFAVGNIRFWRGELTEARHHLECAMAIYLPEHHEALATGFGENAYATSAAYLSWTLCFLGLPDQAKDARRKALAEARRINHPFTLGYVLTFATTLAHMLRDPAETLTFAEETIALADRHGFPLWNVGATLNQSWALVRQGQPEGMESIRRCVDAVASLMYGIRLIFLETMADTLCHLKEFDEALAVIKEARKVVGTLGDRHVEAELHRYEGKCLLGGSSADAVAAEACFQRALTVARGQRARLLELRAATDLAGLWRDQNRSNEARQILAGVYDGFTEGFDIADLREARDLLAELTETEETSAQSPSRR